MSYKARIAKEKEVLALLTSVMRGEITSAVVRGGEVIYVPPTIAERMHAAEQLCKLFGAPGREPADGAPAEMDAFIRALEGGA